MVRTKQENNKAKFKSKEDIDEWYQQAVEGLISILDKGVNIYGVNSLDNFSRNLKPTFENLGLAKITAYQVYLSTTLDENDIISYENAIAKYY